MLTTKLRKILSSSIYGFIFLFLVSSAAYLRKHLKKKRYKKLKIVEHDSEKRYCFVGEWFLKHRDARQHRVKLTGFSL